MRMRAIWGFLWGPSSASRRFEKASRCVLRLCSLSSAQQPPDGRQILGPDLAVIRVSSRQPMARDCRRRSRPMPCAGGGARAARSAAAGVGRRRVKSPNRAMRAWATFKTARMTSSMTAKSASREARTSPINTRRLSSPIARASKNGPPLLRFRPRRRAARGPCRARLAGRQGAKPPPVEVHGRPPRGRPARRNHDGRVDRLHPN